MNPPELDQVWRAQLRQLQTPAGFQEQLHHNLTTQMQTSVSAWLGRRREWRWAAACAAVLLAMALLLAGHTSAPQIIAAAQAHAIEERNGNDIDLTYPTWLADAGVQRLPAGSRVAMAKDCVVTGQPARHLRIMFSNAAQADIFITRAEANSTGSTQGELAERTWWRLQPQKGTTIIVLFDNQIALEQQRRWTQQLLRG